MSTEQQASSCMTDDCPCIQKNCPIWGNCVECIRGHRKHQAHVPECMQPILRGLVADLAKKVELAVVEARPNTTVSAE